MNVPITTCTQCADLRQQVIWLTRQVARLTKAINGLSEARPLRQLRELRRIVDLLYRQVESGIIIDPETCDLHELGSKADDLDEVIERVRDEVDERDEQIRRLEERVTALEHGAGCDHDDQELRRAHNQLCETLDDLHPFGHFPTVETRGTR